MLDSGLATLISGQVVVSSSIVTTNCISIILTYETGRGVLGNLSAANNDIVNNTSFIIKSLGDEGALNIYDGSVVRWCVIA